MSGPDPMRGRWWMLAALTVLVVVSYIDRLALSLLIIPVKHDLGLSDGQAALLLGLAFALFYGVVSIPAGYLVDRYARRWLLFGAVLLWTALTFASGFATSFAQLMLCRAGVGMGEAVLAPVAYSLINQCFAGVHRARAFTAFSLGNAVGGGIALLVAGLLLQWASVLAPFQGLFGLHAPWRQVFLLLGLAGLPMAVLVLTIAEPQRSHQPTDAIGWGAALRHGWARRGLYGPLYLANALVGVGLFGSGAWLPAMIGRRWALLPATIGQVLGPIQIVTSLLGLLGALLVFQSPARRGRGGAIAAAGGMALGAAGLLLVLACLAPIPLAMWGLLGAMGALMPCAPVLSALIFAEITPQRMMGRFSALSFLVVSALGSAVGPLLVTMVAGHSAQGLTLGIAAGPGVALIGAGLCYGVLARRLRIDLRPHDAD